MPGSGPTHLPEQPAIVPPEPGAWPVVVNGGDVVPYIDHGVDVQGVLDPGVIGEKIPVGWGTVQGTPWTLTAFMVRGGDWEAHAGPDGSPGPAGELMLGPHGQFGGGGPSLFNTIPWLPRDLGLSSMAFGSGPLTVHLGVVADSVTAVQFRFEDGTEISQAPIPGPPGVDAGYCILWAPNDVGGTIRALDAEGSVLVEHVLHLPAIGLEWGATAGTSYGGP